MFDKVFFAKNAANIVARYRKHIFDPAGGGRSAKNVWGRRYPEYSSKYSIAKKSGNIKRRDAKFSQSTAPVLTGDLLKDFQGFKLITGGFRFGTPTQGGKVSNLKKLGRPISQDSKPIPDSVEKYIMNKADNYVKSKLGKIKGRTFNI